MKSFNNTLKENWELNESALAALGVVYHLIALFAGIDVAFNSLYTPEIMDASPNNSSYNPLDYIKDTNSIGKGLKLWINQMYRKGRHGMFNRKFGKAIEQVAGSKEFYDYCQKPLEDQSFLDWIDIAKRNSFGKITPEAAVAIWYDVTKNASRAVEKDIEALNKYN